MDHRTALARLSARGRPRGADAVLRAARSQAESAVIAGYQRIPSTPPGDVARGTRPLIVAAAFLGALVVGTVIVLTSAPGDEEATTLPPIDTTTPTITETTQSRHEPELPAVGLVPRDEWPDPSLEPILGLPECDNAVDLAAFMAQEFSESVEHEFEPVPPRLMATLLPMPRVGHLSVFSRDDLVDACVSSGKRGGIVGWWLGNGSGGFVARAAARDESTLEVPLEASQGPYHQSWTALGDALTGSIYPSGRIQAMVRTRDGVRYAVFEAHQLTTGNDFVDGERLAKSFVVAGTFEDRGPGSGYHVVVGPALPHLLPTGFGPCLVGPLVPGLDRTLTHLFCTADGDHIELNVADPSVDDLQIPGDADSTVVGTLEGMAWNTGDRRQVAVVLEMSRGVPLAVWLSGPDDLGDGVLERVLASIAPLDPRVVSPRQSSGPGPVTPTDLAEAVLRSHGIAPEPREPEVTIVGFSLGEDIEADIFSPRMEIGDLAGDRVHLAFAIPVTEVATVGPVDVMVSDRGDFLQFVFRCGETWFNSGFWLPDSPPIAYDPTWSSDPDRRARIFDFLGRFIDAVGCDG